MTRRLSVPKSPSETFVSRLSVCSWTSSGMASKLMSKSVLMSAPESHGWCGQQAV